MKTPKFIKRAARWCLSLPIKATLVHRFPLEKKLGEEALNLTQSGGWDKARAEDGHFFIPNDRGQWIQLCEEDHHHESATGDLPQRAVDILSVLKKHDLPSCIHSVGAGLGALEYHIAKAEPNVVLACSDYSPETCKRLKEVFHECQDVQVLDLKNKSSIQQLSTLPEGALVLLHRVDPHLTNAQWREAFAALRETGVKRVLFVPHVRMDVRYAAGCIMRQLKQRLKGGALAVTGYVRSEKAHRSLFSACYNIIDEPMIGFTKSFLLKSAT
jgi:hypothetical protein